jgi:hypothetical protein
MSNKQAKMDFPDEKLFTEDWNPVFGHNPLLPHNAVSRDRSATNFKGNGS